jgi:Family of unknown function (DUF6526)
MAQKSPQDLAHHARFDPGFHFFVLPVFVISWVVSVVVLVRHPCFYSAWGVVLAMAALVAVTKIRSNALRVQDRVIRLEERLRLTALLAESQRPQIAKLSEDQLIALRFASDEEVAGLVQRALSENLSRSDIKKVVRRWRPDYWRV